MRNNPILKRLLSVFLVLCIVAAWVLPASARAAGIKFTQVSNDRVSANLFGRDAANLKDDQPEYAPNDIVRVSIFLNKAGVIDAGYSVNGLAQNDAAMAYRARLAKDQTSVVAKIEKTTKEKLDVVWNLTLAANLISANVKYSQIEDIESIAAVDCVLIETQYSPDVVSTSAADPNMATSGSQTGTAPAWGAGYTGAGSRVAIIDTGVDVDHISFDATAFEYSLAYRAGLAGMTPDEYRASLNLLTAEEIAAVADQLNVTLTGEEAYINSKIAFGYNYVDGDYDVTHLNDKQGEHGSHVSGIATANAFVPTENGFASALSKVYVQGVAPDAQLLTMKVFGKSGGAYDSDYMAAIEDAIVLGADSVNLSLGSGNPGRSRNSVAKYQAILESLADSGVVVAMSAGNSGNWVENSYPGYLYSDDVSMQTNGSPGSFTNSLSVASVDNAGFVTTFSPIVMVGDLGVFYYDDNNYSGGGTYGNKPFTTLAGDYEYVFLNNIGTPEQFAALGEGALEGKIAMCYRGETSFFEKANAAVSLGAIGVIIVNNVDEIFGMNLTGYEYDAPAVSISLSSGEIFKVNEITADDGTVIGWTGTLNVPSSAFPGMYPNQYYTMSSFSSWGVPGSLELKPEITAPGGEILSVNGANKAYGVSAHDQYEVMSGTSMASPQVAGMAAVMAQYIRENGLEELTGLTARQLAQSLLMSTAAPILADASSYYSVLQQGAGLGNVGAAIMADTYILMDANATASYADGKVKVELGDDPDKTGKYSFSFTINNLDDVDKLYNLSADFFIQAPTSDGYNLYMYTATTLIGALTTFTVDGEEVASVWGMEGMDFNGDGTVNTLDGQALLDYATGLVTELTNKDKADIDGDGDIDSFDAYLYLSAAEALTTVPAGGSVKVDVEVEIPADWKAAIDYYYPNGTYIQGYVFADGISSEEGVVGTSHSIPVLGFYGNWTDASMFDKGSAMEYNYGLEDRAPYMYNTDSNALAANALTILYEGDTTQYLFGGNPMIPDATYMPERNAINSTSKIGRIAFTAIRNATNSRYFVKDIASGELLIAEEIGEVDGAYYYVNGGYWDAYGYYLTVNQSFAGVTDNTQLEVGLTLAPEYYVAADGTTDWDALGEGATFSMPVVVDNTAPVLEDISLSLTGNTLTITASDNQYVSAVVLYNKKGTEVITYTGAKQDIDAGESASYVLDLSTVKGSKFLLQVTDYALNAITYEINLGGEDEPVILPGRIAFNLSKGFWTSFDGNAPTASIIRTEYEASNYTYYAGTIVDNYVFAVTDAGDLHVMPLEDLTDVTVVANLGGAVSDMAYNKADGQIYAVSGTALITIDKLTGEIALAGELPFNTNTLACDGNGTFYSNKYGSGEVYSYTLDTIDAPVQIAKPFTQGSAYVQSMEIDPNTGKLCWAAFYSTTSIMKRNYSYYFEINVEDGTYSKSASLSDELGVLLIPDKTSGGNWANPTDQVSGVQVAPESLSLLRGSSAALSATVTPWTATDRTVTWSSSNDAVATVDKNGVVTAVGTGEAIITATSNLDPNYSASCTVTVTAPAVTVNGVLQDAEGKAQFFSWNMETDDTWTPGVAFNGTVGSVTTDLLNDKVYVNSMGGATMYKINPVTGEIEETVSNGTGVPMWDMEYSTVFSTADAPVVNALYYYYVLPAKDPMNLDTSAFNLSSLLSQMGASYFVGMSSLGIMEDYVDSDGNHVGDAEYVILMDNNGNLLDLYIWAADGGYNAEVYFWETNMSEFGLSFSGTSDGNMFCSLVAADYDNLYLSAFTGETNELYHLYWDNDAFTFQGEYYGDFGTEVWPVALTGVTANGESTDSVNAARGKNAIRIDSTNVTAEELAAAKAEVEALSTMTMVADAAAEEVVENMFVKTPEILQPMGGDSAVTPDEESVTVIVQAGPVSQGSANHTNGAFTITWDTESLELDSYDVRADYTSVNLGEGTMTVGYVEMDGYHSDYPVAYLYFKALNTDAESVTVVYTELGNEHINVEEEVTINYPHANTEIRDAKDPTCTEDGYTGDTYCTDCGKLIAKGNVIPANGHGETEVKDAKSATCTEDGYTGDTYCTVCGDKVADGEAIKANGHSFGDWEETKAPSCTEEGVKSRSCACGEVETAAIPATGHSYEAVVTAPTCTDKGYTTHTCACGDSYVDSYVDATGHSFGEWEETKAPTCTEDGTKVRKCACGETEEGTIDATGHTCESVVTDPTCTEEGYTTHTCACGYVYKDTFVDALGHSFGEWTETKAPTCTEEGVETRTCACGASEDQAIAATGHNHEAVVTAPTCTDKGYTTHTCACGDSYVDSEVEATGHSYESVVTNPTTEAEGYTTHTCEHCGDSYVDSYTDKLPVPDPDNSKTGDNFMAHLWIMGLLGSVAALAALVIYNKKSYKA